MIFYSVPLKYEASIGMLIAMTYKTILVAAEGNDTEF